LNRKIEIVHDMDGKSIVVIHDIRFKGKRRINWKEVEQFLKEYVGDCYEMAQTAEKVYIGSDFPDEFTSSKDTANLRGTLAKAKANATQGVKELLEINTIERYNVFCVQMIIRHDQNGKKYLYDMINIKKEPSTPHCLTRTVKNPVPFKIF